MSDTLQNIKLTANTWVDLYALSGIAAGTQITVSNLTTIPAKLHTSLAQPSAIDAQSTDDGSFSRLTSYGKELNSSGASGAWAYSHTDGLVNITQTISALAGNGGSDLEYGLNIQRGLVPGVSVIHKFGRNPDIDTIDGFEDLWNVGGNYTGFDAIAAEVVEVFSSDASDTSAGSGARAVQLVGLGAGFVEQTEVVILNGTTPVNSVNSYIRLDRALVLTAGSAGVNAGDIVGRQNVTTANVFFEVPSGGNRTLIACYTVPFGKIGYITSGFASLAKKKDAFCNIQALVRFPGSVFQIAEWFTIGASGTGFVERNFKVPLLGIPAGTDIKISADTSQNDTGVAGGFEILLVDV